MSNGKKVAIEVPEELAAAMKEASEAYEKSVAEIRRESGFDWEKMSSAVEAAAAQIEREAIRRLLQECDVDEPAIRINGKRFTRVGRYEAPYFTKAGGVRVVRSVYREDGKRNAKTVDAVSLRVGALEGGWLPEVAKAMSFMVQQTTSREAETAAEKVGRLPYSRSSFERVAHQVGTLYGIEKSRVEDVLIERYELPEGAASISAQLDRFAVAMEEPKARPVGRPKKNAPKREVAQTLAADVKSLLKKKPGLKVVRLSDGGADVRDALAAHVNGERLGVEVVDLIDIWHVVEKLGAAAAVIYGSESAEVVEHWKLRLLNDRHARGRIYEELRASGMEGHRVGNEQPVHEAMTYLTNQAARMLYVDAREDGLPVASGMVESTCKSLGQRMRRPGARWAEETGQHVLDLRALALSNRFDAAIALTLAPLRATVRRAA